MARRGRRLRTQAIPGGQEVLKTLVTSSRTDPNRLRAVRRAAGPHSKKSGVLSKQNAITEQDS